MNAAAFATCFALPQMHGPADEAGLWDRVDESDPEIAQAAEDAVTSASTNHVCTLPAALTDDQLVTLIERIAQRDQRALEALYDATSGRIHGLVLRITQQRALAEEAVEDTFWQVWRQAPRFDSARGRPITWLLAMARTRAIDALRRDERFQHDELPEEGLAEDESASVPAQELLAATRGSVALHEALATLDPRARQLVSLAFFRGLTHDEIAQQEALPLGTVKSLLRRSLQHLRQTLGACP